LPIRDFWNLGVLDDRFSSIESHSALSVPGPGHDLLLPVVLYGTLTDRITDTQYLLEHSLVVRFAAAGAEFGMISVPHGSAAWERMPFPLERCIDVLDEHLIYVQRGIEHLASAYPIGFDCFRRFVRLLTWLQPSPELTHDPEITSASFPSLPLWIFFSNRATVHIAPSAIGTRPSPRFLADNFYHESVHQAVNGLLLFGDVLVDDYSSERSPRVKIPWRSSSDARNREWELDRVFHASMVYESILEYRNSEIADRTIEPWERHIFERSSAAAVDALAYLSAALMENRHLLTSEGCRVVQQLVSVAQRMSR
jgi:hypothetical protein